MTPGGGTKIGLPLQTQLSSLQPQEKTRSSPTFCPSWHAQHPSQRSATQGIDAPQILGVLLNKDLEMFRLPLLLICLAKQKARGSEKKPRMLRLLGRSDAFLHPFQRAARVLIRCRDRESFDVRKGSFSPLRTSKCRGAMHGSVSGLAGGRRWPNKTLDRDETHEAATVPLPIALANPALWVRSLQGFLSQLSRSGRMPGGRIKGKGVARIDLANT